MSKRKRMAISGPKVSCGARRYSCPSEAVDCDKPLLECHRNAPKAIIEAATIRVSGAWWPLVWTDDWCGEFRYAPNEREMGAGGKDKGKS